MNHEYIADLMLVNEIKMARAIRRAHWPERSIIEGSGSIDISALLPGSTIRGAEYHYDVASPGRLRRR